METLPRGSSVYVPKAESQSHLDPRGVCVCVCVCVCVSWKNGSLPVTPKQSYLLQLRNLHFVTGTKEALKFNSGERSFLELCPRIMHFNGPAGHLKRIMGRLLCI